MGRKKNCRKYFIIYETTNLTNCKVYRGKHWTYTPYEFDGYLGSGIAIKAAIKKYGKENFKRETLFVTENEKEAYLKEKELVNLAFVNRKDTYNLRTGGEGGWECSEETKQRHSDATSGENNPMHGRKGRDCPSFGLVRSKETRKRISVAKGGTPTSQETRKKQSDAATGRFCSEETKQKQSDASSGENNPRYGVEVTKDTRIKIAIHHLGSEEIFYQRLKDVRGTDKEVRGCKAKLARKWGISAGGVTQFIKRWFVVEDRGYTPIIEVEERKIK